MREESNVEGNDLLEAIQRQIITMQCNFLLKERSRILKSYPYRFFGFGNATLFSIENCIMEIENVCYEYNSYIDKKRKKVMDEYNKSFKGA